MGILWGVFYQIAVVLLVINGLIWLRAKRQPKQAEDRAMFGSVTTSFGGADFWSAVLVVVTNVVGSQVANAFTGAGELEIGTDGEAVSQANWGVAWLIQAGMLLANWAVSAWRNASFLDWKWSGVAALLIFAASAVLVVLITIIANI
jgi:hypothetical protein